MIPSQPRNLFAKPFAQNGNFDLIPEATDKSGRASLNSGFPVETQRPLSQGGVAPNRLDFNGILNMLSAFAFWQQSGGQFTYSPALNYTTPNVVFHNGVMWWCLKDNGPDSVNGLAEPGTDIQYWKEYFLVLLESGGSNITIGTPVGTVITFWGTEAPDGYFPCSAYAFSATDNPKLAAILGRAVTPDLRGYFIRGYDTRNTVDPNGATRNIDSVQGDAIRNITANVYNGNIEENTFRPPEGAVAVTKLYPGASGNHSGWGWDFDASRVVPVAAENRPKNVNLLYCIKHD